MKYSLQREVWIWRILFTLSVAIFIGRSMLPARQSNNPIVTNSTPAERHARAKEFVEQFHKTTPTLPGTWACSGERGGIMSFFADPEFDAAPHEKNANSWRFYCPTPNPNPAKNSMMGEVKIGGQWKLDGDVLQILVSEDNSTGINKGDGQVLARKFGGSWKIQITSTNSPVVPYLNPAVVPNTQITTMIWRGLDSNSVLLWSKKADAPEPSSFFKSI